MRRLPIYFLIDVSESMIGEPIQLVEEGIATIIKALKEDPYALETVHISVIVFAGAARTVVPLQELINFYPPRFPVGGGTSFGAGLGHLMYELRQNVVLTTPDRKGDWKPIIFLFTDGVPTDDTAAVITEWKKSWAPKSNLVAISFGTETDLHLLRDLTDQAFLFRNTTAQQYKEFFRWVTASIKSSSQSVDAGGAGFELQKVNTDVLEKIDAADMPPRRTVVDTNYAVFVGKCAASKRPYLIKYRRAQQENDLGFQTLQYRLVGAYPVDNTYFELTGSEESTARISTEELHGFPTCPSCGAQFGFAVCGCGKMHCIGAGETSVTCPWCGNVGEYGSGEGHIDLTRSQG